MAQPADGEHLVPGSELRPERDPVPSPPAPSTVRITYVLLLDLHSTRAHALQTVRTAGALAQRGIEVHLHPRASGSRSAAETFEERFGARPPSGLHLHPLPGRRADMARAALALRLVPALLRGDPQHVLLARERRALLPLLHLRRLTGRRVPLVYEFHDLDHRLAEEKGSERRARRILRQETRIAREADGLLATSEPLARDVERCLDPGIPVEIVPNGVDLSAFRGCGRPRLDGPEVRLVYTGSLYPEKGVDTLVRAMAFLPDRVRLTVVGANTPADLDRLRTVARGLEGTGGRIDFVGQVAAPEVPGYLARADLIVIPAGESVHSLTFTSPLKLFEAMASGVPLVVGPSAAFRSVVEPGRTAEVAADLGPRALADAVRRTLDDPERARTMARRAMDRADEYSWERRGERMETALRRTVAERRG